MQSTKIAVLLVTCLAFGCSLFSKSDNGSSGANAPVMYGTGPGSGGPGGLGPGVTGGAGASGTKADAAVSGGAAGSSARSDGGPDATITVLPDAGKTPADADIHNGAQRWIRFGAQTFTKCTWFSAAVGFCNDAPSFIPGMTSLLVNIYKTADGGKNWGLVSAIDTGTSAYDASINVYVFSPTDMWFISGSLGAVPSGSIGHSLDGGKNWTSLTSDVNAYLRGAPADAGVTSLPLWQLAAGGGGIWLLPQGGNLGFSQDGGRTWKKIAPPPDFAAASSRSLIATQNNLLLSFLRIDNSLGLYRWNGSIFVAAEGILPASSAGDRAGTWWRSSPNVEGVLFVDRGPLPAWASPFWAYATIDGGMTFQRLLGGTIGTSSDVVGLSDGLAFAALASVTAYVGGIFSDTVGNPYLEIRRTSDAGKTWSTLHSEPYPGDYAYISVAVDPTGTVHAMHYRTESVGAATSYDAHYVLQ
ncbi:MAG TPA: hypothetical protein VJ801_06775 [Polyangia bacterium]|jgi:BNR/Asp-box repeat.|nr:hypothetical protein [Polyangia bacterium]